MSPLNRGPLVGSRPLPTGMRPLPPPRFGGRLVPHGMPPRMPLPIFGGPGPLRQRVPLPPRPAGVSRPNGLLPLFPGPRPRGMIPGIVPPIAPRGIGLRNPMRHWYRRIPPPPPQMMPPMRPRFAAGNGNIKVKTMNNTKKVNKHEELELKKPWMTDEIRTEIQKKNKLYAKAKKNKDAVEWDEFKDLRNKVTRMIRDAKNEYLAKQPEQGGQKTDDNNTIESEGVQKTENSTEQSEQTEQMEETQPTSKQAHLYPDNEESHAQNDESDISSKDNISYYCNVCNINFLSEYTLIEHKCTHKLCGIDDCTFVAHPLLVAKHISIQHSTGLCANLKDLSKEEAARKWTEERRKKFPTKDNIMLREAENLEKLQRGETIKQRWNVPKAMRTTSTHRKIFKPYNRITYKIDNYSHTDETYRSLCTFSGINILQEEDSSETCLNKQTEQTDFHNKTVSNISDENDVSQPHTEPKSVNLSTSFLVANYKTEKENIFPERMGDLRDHKVAEDTIFEKPFNDMRSCTNTSENKLNYQTITNEISQYPVTNRQHKHKYKTDQIVKDKRPEKISSRYHNNLLEKLLSRSIQYERNLIFQSLKYVVDNNFFELSDVEYCS